MGKRRCIAVMIDLVSSDANGNLQTPEALALGKGPKVPSGPQNRYGCL